MMMVWHGTISRVTQQQSDFRVLTHFYILYDCDTFQINSENLFFFKLLTGILRNIRILFKLMKNEKKNMKSNKINCHS